ncbi:MAG: peptidylprolyl isomerase [Proteobacteria bacterium]|nr:peptidylprolyl isomerase [Pseudomonadota bacterium]
MKSSEKTIVKLMLLAVMLPLLAVACKSKEPVVGEELSKEPAASSVEAVSPLKALPEVIARVNGVELKKTDLERVYEAVAAQSKMTGDGKSDTEIINFALGELIDAEVLKQETEKKNIVPSAEEIDKEIENIKSQFPDIETFEKTIAEKGVTIEKIRENIVTQLAMRDMLAKEVETDITIAKSEIEKFYNDNPTYFQTQESMKASHILIKVEEGADEKAVTEARKKIDAILKELKAGGDFAEIAKKSSEGPSGPNGGDLGYFGSGQMVKPFEDAALALNVGEVSAAVKTQFGFHVIKLTDKKDGGITPLNEVSESIEIYLKRAESGKRYAKFIERIRSTANIEKLI